MDEIIINIIKKPKIKDVIFIEGLPGVGNVGKLAAEHLIDELKAKKFADVYSRYFPPQVLVDDDGVVKLVNNELYFAKHNKHLKSDLLFLVGDYQGLTPEGQYNLSQRLLDIAEGFGVKLIITLGGYGLGRMIDKPKVLGAVSNPEMIKEMKDFGVVFQRGEPGSGIVGASGLLLGLGKIKNINGVCLMGETSGYFADPKSAQEVLKVLTKILNIEIDFSELEVKANQIDKITSQIRDIEPPKIKPKEEDLHYIG
ncbi:proteasome assembly chaperone family protein [[Eubacterium] cellulosolvens]